MAAACHWHGWQADAPSTIAAADIAVLASRNEGFSASVMEAMLAGVACAVVAPSAQPIQHGQLGQELTMDDPRQVAEELACFWLSEQRPAQTAAAQQYAQQHYTMTVSDERTLNLYRAMQQQPVTETTLFHRRQIGSLLPPTI